MTHCILCRQSYQQGYADLSVCCKCWELLSPGEKAALQASAWNYAATAKMAEQVGETRVEINLFRVFIEEFIQECRNAAAEQREFRFPWNRFNEGNN